MVHKIKDCTKLIVIQFATITDKTELINRVTYAHN